MSPSHITRRRLLQATSALALADMRQTSASAQSMPSNPSPVYYAPAGRISFRKPAELKAVNNRWILIDRLGLPAVWIQETLRFDGYDNYLWNGPGTVHFTEIDAGPPPPGFEIRRFHLRHDANRDEVVVVLHDATWTGAIQVSTQTANREPQPRWRESRDEIINSITVRKALDLSEAFSELGFRLATDGLNPRFVGEELLLGVTPVTSPYVARGIRSSHIRLRFVTQVPVGANFTEREQHIDSAITAWRNFGGKRIEGQHCRGIDFGELKSSSLQDVYSNRIMAFGRTREQLIEASYSAADREPILEALHRVFQSIELLDLG